MENRILLFEGPGTGSFGVAAFAPSHVGPPYPRSPRFELGAGAPPPISHNDGEKGLAGRLQNADKGIKQLHNRWTSSD